MVEGSKALVVISANQVKTLIEKSETSFSGHYNDDLGEEDCKTGQDEQVYFNVMPYTPMI